MNILRAAALGLMHPFAEFFPLCSKAHILLLKYFFIFPSSYPVYELVLDLGILFATFVFYAREMQGMLLQTPILFEAPFQKNKRDLFSKYPYALVLSLLLISTLATGIMRMILGDLIGSISHRPWVIGVFWIAMGLLLFISKRFRFGNRSIFEMNHQDAFLIGVAQGFTLLPGISRVGVAWVAGLVVGLEPKEAAKYSFLLGVLYLICELLIEIKSGFWEHSANEWALGISFLVSLLGGVFFLALAIRQIEKRKYYLWGIYCMAIGFISVMAPFFKP